ncbi:P63C domain-containing protein [Alloacidobacterium dinghuense]|nr:P63C domain-containing protein [Alloacidobacterium dinghuense]
MSDESTGKAKGGFARAEVLSPEKRSQIAKKAALARWGDSEAVDAAIQPTHNGQIHINGLDIDCVVLSDGRRVISQRAVGRALGRRRGGEDYYRRKTGSSGGELPEFLGAKNLNPFISDELRMAVSKPIFYGDKGRVAYGIEAQLLPQICDVWLKARDHGALKTIQLPVAQRVEILMRGLAHVGIIALVDEATGYQEVRPKDALQAFLEKIIAKELAAWAKKFPDEFYENIYKLKNWPWPGMKKNRYSVVAYYTRDLVYERLAPGLLKELESKSPKNDSGNRTNKLHQWLTDDIGNPMLAQHLHSVIMFQRLAIASGYGWHRFLKMVDQVMPRRGATLEIPFPVPDEID